MPTLNELGYELWYKIFWITPYRTGNLARNGISDMGTTGFNAVGFRLFGKGTEYGSLLNEAPIIHYAVRNPVTKILYTGQYTNRHYQWVDRFVENAVEEFKSELGGY